MVHEMTQAPPTSGGTQQLPLASLLSVILKLDSLNEKR